MVGKGVFEKEKAKFSKEIYKIVEQVGYRYILMNEKGDLVKKKYRASELLKIGNVKERLGNK
jgi:hypothetical protein